MRKQERWGVVAVFLMLALCMGGCGETIKGAGKDCSRVYRGVKTIFVSD
ncbi:MAG TPA: hypothetical protein PKL97_01075 [Candidatus Omnitrophota bacterium]|nr:hypothetical protein [Candidatus Omnitrophota bacterium]